MAVRFTNSCALIDYPCTVGRKYIDPCTCYRYFECQTGGYDFLSRQCGGGTAWNHKTGFCIRKEEIFIADGTPICKEDEPWLRCSQVPNHFSESRLENFCDPGNPTNPNGYGDDDGGGGGGAGSSSTGAIVGGVVAALVAVVFVACLVIWMKKRQTRNKCKKSIAFKPSIHRIDSVEKEEEVYDVIDEKLAEGSAVVIVDNKAYGKQPPPPAAATEYDNPAFNDQSEKSNYFNVSQISHQNDRSGRQHLDVPSMRGQSTNADSQRHSSNANGDGQFFRREDDLSRSISVGGTDILVEDSQGYHIGYPSGTIPRQPSPLPIPPEDGTIDEPFDYGYDLGKMPSDYRGLEKTDL